MSQVTGMDESRHTYVWVMARLCVRHSTYEWVMSHTIMSLVSHMDESCIIYMSRVAHMCESWHICAWGMAPCHTWMSHVSHINQSWLIWISRVTHMYGSWHIYGWVMAQIKMRHGTYMNESWYKCDSTTSFLEAGFRPLYPSCVWFVPLIQTKRVFWISTRTHPRS